MGTTAYVTWVNLSFSSILPIFPFFFLLSLSSIYIAPFPTSLCSLPSQKQHPESAEYSFPPLTHHFLWGQLCHHQEAILWEGTPWFSNSHPGLHSQCSAQALLCARVGGTVPKRHLENTNHHSIYPLLACVGQCSLDLTQKSFYFITQLLWPGMARCQCPCFLKWQWTVTCGQGLFVRLTPSSTVALQY